MARLRPTPARATRATANNSSSIAETEQSKEPAVTETENPKELTAVAASPRKGSLRRPRTNVKSQTAKNSTAAPSTPEPTILYPSLSPEQVVAASIETSSKKLYPQLSTETPKKRSIPVPVATSTAKPTVSTALPSTTPTSTESGLPSLQGFEFKFSAGLEEYGKKIVDELQITSAAVRAQMPVTPPNKDATAQTSAATTGRRRFSDIHKKNFDKMDSISNHYAARRTTPRKTVQTPINPQKGIKRTKSQISIDKGDTPTSPSPVKKRPTVPVEEDNRVKRVKLNDAPQTKVSKSSAARPKSTLPRSKIPTTSAGAGTSLATRFSALKPKRRPLPAHPCLTTRDQTDTATQEHLKPPTNVASKELPSSKLPVTPGRSKLDPITLNTPRKLFAPNTIAAPKASLPPSSTDPTGRPIKRATGATQPPKATPGKFTFSSKEPGAGFKRLSDMHTLSQQAEPTYPNLFKANFTETSDLADPFSPIPEQDRRETRIWSPTIHKTPQLSMSPKRKARDSPPIEDEVEEFLQPSASPSKKCNMNSPAKETTEKEDPVAKPPAAKRLRFDSSESKAPSSVASPTANEAKVRATPGPLKKSRLDFLATPKRLMNKALGRTGQKSARKPLWK